MEPRFIGQQEGERVLYEVISHPVRHYVKVGRVLLLAGLIIILFWIMSSAAEWLLPVGWVIGVVFGVLGWWGTTRMEVKSKAYVTDRRLVRLSAVTPWTINSRTLSWDEVVKIKTKSSNAFWQILGAGSVVAHARSTVLPVEERSEQIHTNDDIEMEYAIYYQDLGNYLDKVLYLFKNDKKELAGIKPFVAKPKGKRY